MKTITIVGISKSGKTSSIRYAILKVLKENIFLVEYNSKHYSNNPTLLSQCIKEDFQTPKGYTGQITCVGRIGKKNVCITTYGDSYDYDIKPALKKGETLLGNLDLFVCASHGKGLEELKQEYGGKYLIELHKERSSNANSLDKDNRQFGFEVAKTILKEL